jgi:apolipoprotein N-acyltransferase
MARIVKLWPALLSALLFLAAFPPLNLFPLIFVCLVPWIWFLKTSSKKGAFWSGYFLGFVLYLGQIEFFRPLVARWTDSAALGLVPWFVGAFIGAFYFAYTGIALRYCLQKRFYWGIPVVWAGVEVIRSYLPGLAFPWFILATPLWRVPQTMGVAFFGTIYLVSAWVVTLNVLLVLFMAKESVRQKIVLSSCFVVVLGVSIVWQLRDIKGNRVKIGVGQPGVDMAFGDPSTREQQLTNNVERLIDSARSQGVAFLALPEGVSESALYPPQPSFRLPNDLPVLFGGRRGESPSYQTAFAYDRGAWSYADKSRLVVFGEYVPGRDYLPFLKNFKLPSGDLKAGEKVTALRIGGITVGPLLCFEGLFYDVSHQQSQNGAQVLAGMAIDDWYQGTTALEQLRVLAIWRAVETGLPVVRSVALGYSMAVDQKGNVIAAAPYGECVCLPAELTIEKTPLKNPARPWFPWASAAAALLAVCAAIRANWRARKPKHLS